MNNSDVTVVVADPLRLRAIRLGAHFTGRVLYFSDSNLISAFESIRAHQVGLLALEATFAHTPAGRAFVDRYKNLAISGSAVQLISFANGTWSTATTAPAAAKPAAPHIPIDTRRVPRFPVVDPLALKVDGQKTNLVDMSVMGAQLLSAPPLRPSQRLKITLPDEGGSSLSVSACVAWSKFELPSNTLPHYRAGMEFTDAAVQVLEDFCKRHCSEEPLGLRW